MGDPVWIVCQLSLTGGAPMNNSFLNQFSANIKFKYFCFDRVVIRGYILMLFFPGGVVRLLRALGFSRLSNGVMRILTDQLNVHEWIFIKSKRLKFHRFSTHRSAKFSAKPLQQTFFHFDAFFAGVAGLFLVYAGHVAHYHQEKNYHRSRS